MPLSLQYEISKRTIKYQSNVTNKQMACLPLSPGTRLRHLFRWEGSRYIFPWGEHREDVKDKCIFSVSKTRRKNLVWWHPCRIQSPKKGIKKKKKVVSSLFCAHFFCCLKSFLTLTRCNIWITRIHSLPVWIKVSGQKSKQRHRGVPKPAKRCDPGVLGPVQGLLSVAHGWNTSGVTVSG